MVSGPLEWLGFATASIAAKELLPIIRSSYSHLGTVVEGTGSDVPL